MPAARGGAGLAAGRRAGGGRRLLAAGGVFVAVCGRDAAARVRRAGWRGEILPASADRGPGDVALLTAASMCFALGAETVELFKHLAAAEAGPLAGLAALPGLRTLRPKLAAIAVWADP